MTTTVELGTLWLNYAADPTDFESFPWQEQLEGEKTQDGDRVITAGGRRRMILRAGTQDDWAVDLPQCTADQIDWLREHIGLTLCARNDRGGKIFTVITSVPWTNHQYDFGADSKLALLEITYSEAV